MLPEHLSEYSVAVALAGFDEFAITGGKFEFGELTLEIDASSIKTACGYLKHEQGFVRLSTVTGVDWYPSEPRFEVVYHLHALRPSRRLRLKCKLRGELPAIDSVCSVWRAANWYEREVFDLFGINFFNHPNLKRIMLPQDWEGHPLRKDYPVTGNRV